MTASPPSGDGAIILPSGGGTTGELLRATDWSATALGPAASWPASLKAIVRMMLATRQPTCLFWGPHLINLYNDGFIGLLGEKHPRAMGQPARECWSDAWPVVGQLLTNVVERGEAVLFEQMKIPIVRRGRLEDAWWNYSYSPLFDDAGTIAGVLVVATETTAEVAGRHSLEAARVEADVAREKLHALFLQAEAASGAKDEFLAMVSHELRNPLNAILGWSRLLSSGTRQPSQMEKGLEIIERNAKAQAKLIDEILDVSRITSGKVLLELRNVHLSSVIQSAVDSIRPAAEAKAVRLVWSAAEGSVDLIADEDRLHQVVWNLLTNAVKFTDPGGEVRITTERDGANVAIRVADTGQGIPPSLLPFVFDRFRQGDASTTKHHAGLGLGLAIVRSLVALHGGTVSAHSEGPGRGALFEIVLPLRAVEPVAPVAPLAVGDSGPAPASGAGATSLAGTRVLVVDDEDDARELVATVLQRAGAQVTAVGSVAAAMAVLASTPITVVVSDIGMPTEDGHTLAQRMRADASSAIRAVPALALTAYARAEERQRALNAGFQEHLSKPFRPDLLIRSVAALASRRHL